MCLQVDSCRWVSASALLVSSKLLEDGGEVDIAPLAALSWPEGHQPSPGHLCLEGAPDVPSPASLAWEICVPSRRGRANKPALDVLGDQASQGEVYPPRAYDTLHCHPASSTLTPSLLLICRVLRPQHPA